MSTESRRGLGRYLNLLSAALFLGGLYEFYAALPVSDNLAAFLAPTIMMVASVLAIKFARVLKRS